MVERIQWVGKRGLHFCREVGSAGIFLFATIFRLPRFRKNFFLLVEQLYNVGVFSLSIIIVSGLFIGMVVGLQGYNTLNKFGSTSYLGQLLALSITRELGPVMTALLFAGRAGSALTAEIGLMKATDQLSSMEMMGVDPLGKVIFPRFWAGFISMPLLSMIFSMVAIWGGYMVGVEWLGIDYGSFWNNMQDSVNFRIDVLGGIYKSIVFGFVIVWIAIYQGYTTKPTAEGIGRATTQSVVYASLSVLALDFIMTALMIGEW